MAVVTGRRAVDVDGHLNTRTDKLGFYKVKTYVQERKYIPKIKEFKTKFYIDVDKKREFKSFLDVKQRDYNKVHTFSKDQQNSILDDTGSKVHDTDHTRGTSKLQRIINILRADKSRIEPEVRHIQSPTPSEMDFQDEMIMVHPKLYRKPGWEMTAGSKPPKNIRVEMVVSETEFDW